MLLPGVFLVVVLIAVDDLLPSHYAVSRSIDIDAPPAKIDPLVVEPVAWKPWSAWNRRDPDMAVIHAGPASGVGAQWKWKSRSEGSGETTLAESDRRIGYSLFFPDFGSTATGFITLDASSPTTTRVTWPTRANSATTR